MGGDSAPHFFSQPGRSQAHLARDRGYGNSESLANFLRSQPTKEAHLDNLRLPMTWSTASPFPGEMIATLAANTLLGVG